MSLVLEICDQNASHRLPITSEGQFLGRSPESDVQLQDKVVSARHLFINLSTDGRVKIQDLGSTNGTYVNGHLIQESHLYLGDRLHIGQVTIGLVEELMSLRERRLHTKSAHRTSSMTLVGLYDKMKTEEHKVQQALEVARQRRRDDSVEKTTSIKILAPQEKDRDNELLETLHSFRQQHRGEAPG